MSRGRLLASLYEALSRISVLRDDVSDLTPELAETQLARYLFQLDAFEREALRLMAGIEGERVVAH